MVSVSVSKSLHPLCLVPQQKVMCSIKVYCVEAAVGTGRALVASPNPYLTHGSFSIKHNLSLMLKGCEKVVLSFL